MYLPMIGNRNAGTNQKIDLTGFWGLSRKEKIDDRQLSSMYNMSSDSIPAMSPRKSRLAVASHKNITEICTPEYSADNLDSFTGVADGYFYYNGTAVDNIKLSDEPKSIVDFNGNICIFPDKLYYCYLPDGETGEISNQMQKMDKSLLLSNVTFFSSLDKISGEYSAYLSKSGANFDKHFNIGDSIIIEGCSDEQNNTVVIQDRHTNAGSENIVSVVVNEVTTSKLSLLMYTKSGSYALFNNKNENNEITIKTSIPDMNHVCVHNNRLWGTSENGQYVYASKLGDCFNFNSFQGLSDDSWYSEIGTAGGFTGIISYRSAVVAFKQNYIHHIYGDSPDNFSIPKQVFGGTPDGKSIVELGGVLYYMAFDGFYEYSGGEPEKISQCINTLYKSCAAGTDGRHYYACGKKSSGECEVMVYDPEYSVWYKEDNTEFVGFVKHNEFMYGATHDGMYRFGDGSENVNWCVVSKNFTLDNMDFKGVNAVYIRMDAPIGTTVNVYISYDEQEFIETGNIVGEGFLTYMIPVRFNKCDSFRIMLDGTGHVVVHDIEIVTYTGGKTNDKHKR